MLNILVCVKQVPDVNLVKMDSVTGSLIRKGVPAILNPNDANAVEAAVQLKERYGGTVSCMTMGPEQAAEALKECLAAGADKAFLLSDKAFANADTLATSYVITNAAKMLGTYDIILCGKESLDGATGQMPSQIAERLNTSQLSSVLRVLDVNEKERCITVQRELEKGVQTAKGRLPCLLTVEKTYYRPRIPSLKSWKASRKVKIPAFNSKTIKDLDTEQIGDPGSPTKVPRTYPHEAKGLCKFINEGSSYKNAQAMLALLAGEL